MFRPAPPLPQNYKNATACTHLAQQAPDAAVEEVAPHMGIHRRQRVIQQVDICRRR